MKIDISVPAIISIFKEIQKSEFQIPQQLEKIIERMQGIEKWAEDIFCY